MLVGGASRAAGSSSDRQNGPLDPCNGVEISRRLFDKGSDVWV